MSINIGDDARLKYVLKKLSKRFEVKEIKGKEETFYQITPTKEQLMLLIKDGFFTGNELEKIPLLLASQVTKKLPQIHRFFAFNQ